jgi:hypothetical protein
VSQRSAARRRQAAPGISDTTPPETFTGTGSEDEALVAPLKAVDADTSKTGRQTTNLPVLVKIQLPMVTDSPVGGKSRWDRRIAALAACVAISIAGATAILIAGSTDDTVTTARTGAPRTPAPALATASATEAASGQTSQAPIGTVAEMPSAALKAIVPEPPRTKIDTVLIDVKGQAIVTGLAPPEAELIVLHNRQPLGTARSNAAGVWTFAARVPTRTNRNEISVVPMRIDNSVLVTDLPAVPRPSRRPAIPSYYFAQIASLPSAADAGREAAKLTARLTGIVAAHRISVRVATIENGRKVYRVAISGFSTKAGATDICGRIRARNTSCLVMRGS